MQTSVNSGCVCAVNRYPKITLLVTFSIRYLVNIALMSVDEHEAINCWIQTFTR